ncbi:MAG TPA: glycosyltransferase, partial [Parafilimonas sp.]
MRVLHIVPSYKPAYQYGGTIESVARLCEGLVQSGVEVKVFTTTANGSEELNVKPGVEYIVEGVKVIYFKRLTKDHSHITVSLWKKLYKEYKNYDVVHIHSWWNILVLVATFICKQKKVKLVLSPHGMLSDYIINNSKAKLKFLIHTFIGKRLLKSALLHTTSKAELTECKKLIPGWKGFVVPNIVWLPQLEIEKKTNKAFTILFLSRIHPKKGIELLMEAISTLKINVHLAIAGAGEKDYIEGLKKKAKKLELQNKIEWLGWIDREQKFDILMQADLFALTSYNENFANVVIESLHVGTPVLLSQEVGLSQFVAENNLGWICTLSSEDITQKIEAAVQDTEKRERIKNCAPKIIQKYFSAETLIPQ